MTLPKLFGTSGIRGHAKKLFTKQFCFDIGRTFAKFLDQHRQEGPIAIGMDPRGSSPRILNAIQQGLAYAGRSILDQGASPSPAMCYVLKASPAIGSMMVTGSHIAPDLNGIKFFAFEEEILKKHEVEITKSYSQLKGKIPYQKRLIQIKEENQANEEYEEVLVRLGKDYPRWKAIVDPGNGAQSDLMPRVLQRLGLEVAAINDELQKEFIARDTETEGVLKDLQARVVNEKADFGIAYDADGDRVIFIDEKGQFIPGDYTGALVAKGSDSPKIVTPISTSQVIDKIGRPIIRTKVGSPYVVAAMKKNQASFGFEASGGGISAEVMMSRDGGSMTIKLLNSLKEHGQSLSNFVATLPRFFLHRVKTDCPRRMNPLVIKKAKEKFTGKYNETDGLKIWLDSTTWMLFRPSSNAPEFRVFAEAKERQKAIKLAKEGMNLVKEVIGKKS